VPRSVAYCKFCLHTTPTSAVSTWRWQKKKRFKLKEAPRPQIINPKPYYMEVAEEEEVQAQRGAYMSCLKRRLHVLPKEAPTCPA
jgi:hypothetical protein